MKATAPRHPHALAHLGVPFFWPMTAAAVMAEEGLELYARNLELLAEELTGSPTRP